MSAAKALYGHTLARDFGPLALNAVRQKMVDVGLSRGVVNQRVGRVKRIFKWAVAEELVQPGVHQALHLIRRAGRLFLTCSSPARGG
jgi:hypothetical protein